MSSGIASWCDCGVAISSSKRSAIGGTSMRSFITGGMFSGGRTACTTTAITAAQAIVWKSCFALALVNKPFAGFIILNTRLRAFSGVS